MRKKQKQESEAQKKKIAEYHQKKRQTEELLANANYVDFEDLENDEDLMGVQPSHATDGRDRLDSYVEELSMLKGRKRAPPAVN